MSVSLGNSFDLAKQSSIFKPHLHLCLQTQMRKSIVSARRNKAARPFFGSAKSRKLVLESAYLIASNLKIIPQPLDFIIREYATGNGGGGSGDGDGVGGFGFWRGGFDGWGRKKKRKWKFWGVFVILGILGVWLVLGKEFEFDTLWGVLGLSLVGVSVKGWWMSGFRDWALGFCCCAVLLGWALKRDDLQRWAKNFGPLKIVGRKRRGRTWAFHR